MTDFHIGLCQGPTNYIRETLEKKRQLRQSKESSVPFATTTALPGRRNSTSNGTRRTLMHTGSLSLLLAERGSPSTAKQPEADAEQLPKN